MVNPMVIAGGLQAVGGLLGGRSAKKAARAEMARLQQAKDEATDRFQPYADLGKEATNPLMASMGIEGYSDDYNDPLLAQIQDQASRRINQQFAATGNRYSGDAQSNIALGMLEPAYNMKMQRQQRLMEMMGIGMNADTNIANAGMQMAQPMATAGSTIAGASGVGMQNMLGGLGTMLGGMGGKKTPTSTTPTGYVNGNPMSMGYQSTAKKSYF